MQRLVAHKVPLVGRNWRQLADNVLAEFRVSNSMAWCLIYLDRLGPDARQIDLAQAIGISQPSTVSVLNQLEASGFVERAQNPDDKRSNRMLLTEAGTDIVSKIEGRLIELRRELFDGVSDADIATMLGLLDLLSDRIAQKRV
jgi:MarR family transcriptional regulator, transcriptional regulator for hemolysin